MRQMAADSIANAPQTETIRIANTATYPPVPSDAATIVSAAAYSSCCALGAQKSKTDFQLSYNACLSQSTQGVAPRVTIVTGDVARRAGRAPNPRVVEVRHDASWNSFAHTRDYESNARPRRQRLRIPQLS
jgi:hypothetical protein